MSLEDEMRSTTVALDALTQSVDRLCGMISQMMAANGDEVEQPPKTVGKKDSEDSKPVVSDTKAVEPEKESKESKKESKETVHTHDELRRLLNTYKNNVGVTLAKKLMPKLGYKNSSDVPLEKLDEIYDRVHELVFGDAEEEEL